MEDPKSKEAHSQLNNQQMTMRKNVLIISRIVYMYISHQT